MSNDEINTTTHEIRYLQFKLGGESYAIELLKVKEVMPVPETKGLPNLPSYFQAVTNLRGEIIPIMDFRTRLNICSVTKELEKAVIVVDYGDEGIGVIVDSINKVLLIESSKIDKVSSLKSQLNEKYVDGRYKSKDEGITILLDMKSILKAENLLDFKNKVS